MNSGEITARHIATGQGIQLRWGDGIINSLEPASNAPKDLWVGPALIDLQVNGFAGVDFQQDHLSAEDLLRAVGGLRAAGCARFLLTLITDEWPRLMARVKHLRAVRSRSSELQNAIAGWHIEGPFLSAEAGYCGAHDPSVMCDPTPAHMQELRDSAGNDPVLLTLAPERTDAIAAIAKAVSLGIRVSLGHTNATHYRLLQAVKAGARGFTHLGNAIPENINRFDNILWRVFETAGLLVSLIPDQIHVSPPLFRLAHRLLGHNSIYYTTDAMAAAGAAPGRFRLGRLELEAGEDGVVRQPGRSNFAGSALAPIEGVFRAAEMLELDWREIWAGFSDRPAYLMGFRHALAAGESTPFCVLRVAEPNRLESVEVIDPGKQA